MKYALSALAGALLVTSAIIWTGGNQTAMFLAGGFTASLVWLLSAEVIGFAPVGKFFLALDGALKHNSHAGVAGSAAPENLPGIRDLEHASAQSRRAVTPGRRKNHIAHPGTVVSFQKPKIDVLKPLQQEVVSALVNLGMPMNQAIQNVTAETQKHPGLDFDSLFRMCLPNQKRVSA